MADTERYQMHCQYCQQRFESNTVAEALRKVEEHEREKHAQRAVRGYDAAIPA